MRPGLKLLVAGAMLAARALAQESELGAEFRGEGERFSNSCGSFKIIGCATLLLTDHPLHIAAGSLAAQNGFAAGPAFSFEHHTAPRKNRSRWRMSFNLDAVASTNLSWRAGAYMTAMYIPGQTIGVVQGVPKPGQTNLTRKSPVINAYAQSESLNKLLDYGTGQDSSRNNLSIFGMRETMVGASILWPVIQKISLSLFAEANARAVALRSGDAGSVVVNPFYGYTPAVTATMASQPTFGQFGQGIRLEPDLFRDHLKLNYAATFQEFVAPGSGLSFQRIALDLGHEITLYGTSTGAAPRQFNGPDSCAINTSSGECPKPDKPAFKLTESSDASGSINLRFLYTASLTSAGNAVPFYFQPTLGGSDLNGQVLLPSYADYRFRAPNRILFRESFEHSVWGPIGFMFLADQGKVAERRGDLGFYHLAHSFATGITLRAGGFPAVSLLFAWGGKEGTHNLALINPSLLGGGTRPSLY